MPSASLIYCPQCCECNLSEENGLYKCAVCGALISLEEKKSIEEKLDAALARGEEANLGKLRNLLKAELNAEYPTPSEILSCCNSILSILPDDPIANIVKAFYRRHNHRKEYQLLLGETKAKLSDYQKKMVYPYVIGLCELIDAPAVRGFLIAQGDEGKLGEVDLALKQREIEDDLFANVPRDVFICHAHADMDKIKPLLDRLEQDEGYTLWYSERNLPKDTENYKANIAKAIENCSVFLVFASSLCMASKDVQWELDVADQLKKTRRIEYRLEDRGNNVRFKHFFDGIQWVDGAHHEDYDLLAERIYSALRQEEPAVVAPVPVVEPPKPEPVIEPKPEPIPEPKPKPQEKAKPQASLDNFVFEVEGNKAVLVKYKGTSPDVVVPETYNGKKVCSIASEAFKLSPHITSISIPDTLESIGMGALFNLRDAKLNEHAGGLYYGNEGNPYVYLLKLKDADVTHLDIAYGCKAIHGLAFFAHVHSKLQSVSIPSTVTMIPGGVFGSCFGLKSVSVAPGNPVYDSRNNCNAVIKTKANALIAACGGTAIPNSVESIEHLAFYKTNVHSIVIPASVKRIDKEAFSDCHSEIALQVDPGNPYFSSRGGMLIDKKTLKPLKIQVPESPKPSPDLSGLGAQIEQSVKGNMPDLSNLGSQIEHTVQDALASAGIGNQQASQEDMEALDDFMAEFNANLNKPKKKPAAKPAAPKPAPAPKPAAKPAEKANPDSDFEWAMSSEGAVVEKYIGKAGRVVIPSQHKGKPVVRIDFSAFGALEIQSVSMPDSITSIGEHAFAGCKNLSTIKWSSSIEIIGAYAFHGCSIRTLNLPTDKLKIIGNGAFGLCESLTFLAINNYRNDGSGIEIGDFAFSCCFSLVDVELAGVVALGKEAFSSCSKLDHLILYAPELKKVGASIAKGCSPKFHFTVQGNPSTMDNWDKNWNKSGALSRFKYKLG